MKLFALVFNDKYIAQVTVEDDSIQDLTEKNGGVLIETKLDGSIRKNYARLDGVYDKDHDAFIDPSPYPSWVLNKTTFKWEAPVPIPDENKKFNWDEKTISWVERVEPPAEAP